MSAERLGDSLRERIGERTSPRRKRVVLADRRGTRPVSRTVIDLEEQHGAAEELVNKLIGKQLRNALGLAGITLLVLGGLPLLFWLFPGLAESAPLGIRLSWLMLGVFPFPFLVLIGYLSTRRSEANEHEFVREVER